MPTVNSVTGRARTTTLSDLRDRNVAQIDAYREATTHLEGRRWQLRELVVSFIRSEDKDQESIHEGHCLPFTGLRHVKVWLLIVWNDVSIPNNTLTFGSEDRILIQGYSFGKLKEHFEESLVCLKVCHGSRVDVWHPVFNHLPHLFGKGLSRVTFIVRGSLQSRSC